MSDTPHTGRVNHIAAFVGTTRAVSGGGKQVCAWDDSGKLAWRVDADQYEVNAVLACASGCVVSSGSHGTLAVLDGATGAVRHTHDLSSMPPGRLFELPGGQVIVADEEYENLRVLDVESGALDELDPQWEQGPALDVRVSGTRLRSIGPMAGSCTWELATRSFGGRVMGPEGEAQGFAGDELAFTTTEERVTLWRATDGAVVHEWSGLADVRGGVASPDGARLAIRSKAGVMLLDTATGAIERHIDHGPWPRLTAFSDDGSQLAVVTDANKRSSLQLVEVASGSVVARWEGVRVSTLRWVPGVVLLGLEDGNVERLAL